MTTANTVAVTHTAELIAHLARLSLAERNIPGLTSAQWSALRYFSRASRFSRTLSAFADYHVTTRASASQTIKGLLEKGLVTRTICQRDKRSSRIDLTEKGRNSSANDPFDELVRAISNLPASEQNALTLILEDVLASVGTGSESQSLGSCSKCEFLRKTTEKQPAGPTYFCTRAGEELLEPELHDICMKYRRQDAVNGWLG